MARFSSILFTMCIAACSLAAPTNMHRRQTGDLQCNLARLQLISDVSSASTLLNQLQSNSTLDLSTATSVAVAQAGLNGVNEGVQSILSAVLVGQTAPADSRTQVEDGLNQALVAVSNITDPSATMTAMAVADKLLDAGKAGDVVLAGCK
ncbi:hypothetical protein FB45DRAFT_361672 [Roridomyces roridus]|uniref:Cell wall protein n=1 Tax=Roridomyces roridus TaxID=1738132 RepID=A0AAD7C8T3_9AGAR|nr:hypothetical protein FB45DRAFT_361672 [Roridomyces roridus]